MLATLKVPNNRRFLFQLALALAFLRALTFIPAVYPTPELHRIFAHEPILALIDVLSGGAFARFSVVALGAYPFAAGRFVALILCQSVRNNPLYSETLTRRTRQCAAFAAVIMSWDYLRFMPRPEGAQALGVAALLVGVLSLTAGAMFFIWLGETFISEWYGISLLVAANIVAAVPGYVLTGFRSAKVPVEMAAAFAVIVTLQVVLAMSTRRIKVESARRAPGKSAMPGPETFLPIPVDVSGVLPLLFVLAGLGAMRLGGNLLSGAKIGWIRGLAGAERLWADARGPVFWGLLLVIGVIFKFAFDYANFGAKEAAYNMKRNALFISGVRPGIATQQFLEQKWLRVAWLGPVADTLPIAALGMYYRRGSDVEVLWPLMLTALAFAIRPVRDLLLQLDSVTSSLRYSGFLRRGRLR